MGSCKITFDAIRIINKKSDTDHSDNDWMVAFWFVNDKPGPDSTIVRQDGPFQLFNDSGDWVLDSGQALRPVPLESPPCNDGDLVTVVYSVVNWGYTEYSEQRAAAERFAVSAAKVITEKYLQLAQYVIEEIVPGGKTISDVVDEVGLIPMIRDTVGAALEDVVIPLLNDIIDEINVLLGHPNCNGDVFHDVQVFHPQQPVAAVLTQNTYTAASKTGCGSPAKTSVWWTLERQFDPFPVVPLFPSGPPPSLDLVPVTDDPADSFLGVWQEDPFTPYPIVRVVIARSMAASGLYAVTVTENVDPDFDAVLDAVRDPVSVSTGRVFQYLGNLFGDVRPWETRGISPGLARAYSAASLRNAQAPPDAEGAVGLAVGAQPHEVRDLGSVAFTLSWNRPATTGWPVTSPITGVPSKDILSPGTGSGFAQEIETLDIPERGVRLCLYRVVGGGLSGVHAVRYMRAQTVLFTKADVMLYPQTMV
jgi:hypothetical protein